MVVLDEPDNRPERTPALLMYDEFESYQSLLSLFSLMAYNGLAPHITSDNSGNINATGAVKGLFEIYAHKNMSDEQAKGFAPFFTLMVFNKLPDDWERDNQIEELNTLYKSKDFWDTAGAMFDHYAGIEPYLIKEYDKLHELDNAITLNDLKALIFPYRDLPEDELERLFEICKSGERVWHGEHGIYSALNKHFENIYKAVKAARQALEDKEKSTQLQKKPANIPDVSSLKLEKIGYPVDKVNNNLWGNLPIGKPVKLKAESDKDNRKGKTADIITMLNFEELDGVKISRPLTIYDKRVFIAVANLVNEGQYILTPTMIDKAMGATTKTNAADKEKILESLAALVRARVTIDNTTEAKLYGYERIKGDFPLLAASIVTAYIDGQLTEGALQVAELPKLFQFSINREQVTTIPIKLLESPISKTKANMTLEDYLIKRISQMNNPKKKVPHKILLSTLYEKCDIKERKQRARLVKDKLPALLSHYVKTGYIKSYTLDSTHITIISPTKE